MRDLMLLGTYLTLCVFSFRATPIWALMYIWTDLFQTQRLGYGFLAGKPLSMIFGVLALISWIFIPDKPGRLTPGVAMLILWALWMTITTLNAVVPEAAWFKWDWAFKGTVFAIFLPYFFNTREEIEAAMLTILFGVLGNIIAVGAKTTISGGGYGVDFALVSGGYGMTEGSILAMVAASIIPLLLWVGQHSLLITPVWMRRAAVAGLIFLSAVASLGTFARTGLVAMAVFAISYLLHTKRKFLFIVLVVAGLSTVQGFMGDAWTERMSTMKSASSESSAMGRVAAWMWTLGYVAEHPLGGGFDVYRINSVSIEMADGSVIQDHAKAFHSMYFEVLGEQGIPGFVLLLSMLGWSFVSLGRVKKLARRYPGNEWLFDLAGALRVAAVVYMAGGAFVGVAYIPYLWYLVGIGIALRHYADRLELGDVARQPQQSAMPIVESLTGASNV